MAELRTVRLPGGGGAGEKQGARRIELAAEVGLHLLRLPRSLRLPLSLLRRRDRRHGEAEGGEGTARRRRPELVEQGPTSAGETKLARGRRRSGGGAIPAGRSGGDAIPARRKPDGASSASSAGSPPPPPAAQALRFARQRELWRRARSPSLPGRRSLSTSGVRGSLRSGARRRARARRSRRPAMEASSSSMRGAGLVPSSAPSLFPFRRARAGTPEVGLAPRWRVPSGRDGLWIYRVGE
ncbi:unnamed protein product [Urochloa humidicola]